MEQPNKPDQLTAADVRAAIIDADKAIQRRKNRFAMILLGAFVLLALLVLQWDNIRYQLASPRERENIIRERIDAR